MRLIDSETVKEYLKRVIWGADPKIDKWVEAMPTIDAIPVEWMREKMQKPQMTCANPFGYVLAEWLEEQEAR